MKELAVGYRPRSMMQAMQMELPSAYVGFRVCVKRYSAWRYAVIWVSLMDTASEVRKGIHDWLKGMALSSAVRLAY